MQYDSVRSGESIQCLLYNLAFLRLVQAFRSPSVDDEPIVGSGGNCGVIDRGRHAGI